MDFSYQLYSARNEKSLDEVLKTLKQLGYSQVEGWGGQFADPAALAASLKAAGLTMPTAHMGFAQLEDTAAALKIVDAVGTLDVLVRRHVVVGRFRGLGIRHWAVLCGQARRARRP